ncbi:MAG: pyridoxamine 5'-phosphate oxidase family protein [Acidimicrobiales bacterium]
MPSWTDVTVAAPDLAAVVQRRFEAHGLALLATVRRDGSPRISGLEPLFALGELWLGMMPGSRKAADLLRDPRFALHSATTDKAVTQGDAKLAGRALVVDDDESFARFVEAFDRQTGAPPPPGSFNLFRADVTELSSVLPAGDHLNIDVWRHGRPPTRIERY